MQRLKILVLALFAVFAFGALTAGIASAEEFKLPTLLNAKKELVKEEKFTGTSGVTKLGVLEGNDVECLKDKNEGVLKQVEVLKNPVVFGYLGEVHITFEECKATIGGISVNCTGLGDTTGIILALPEIHLVYDNLSPLSVAILFLVPSTSPVHFTCGGLVLVLVKGEVLCLVSPGLKLTKHFEIKCEAKKLGDPLEVTYWNDEGKAINIENGLLATENDKEFKMASESGEALILTELEVEIMD